MTEKTAVTGLQKRLESEPDYRPYCLNCHTMQRMTIVEREGRRILKCELAPETHEGAILLMARFGIPPRIGCGIEYDIDADKIVSEGVKRAGYPR